MGWRRGVLSVQICHGFLRFDSEKGVGKFLYSKAQSKLPLKLNHALPPLCFLTEKETLLDCVMPL